jgi:hypothetical protein
MMRRKANLVLGALAGVMVAVLISLVAVMMYVLRGPQMFERLGISLTSTIALYFAGGIIGGSLVGLLLPLATWRWGAVLVGIIAAMPVYLGAGVLLGEDLSIGIFLAIIVGGVVGYLTWSPVRSAASNGDER